MNFSRNRNGLVALLLVSLFSPASAAWSASPDRVGIEIIDDYGRVFRQFDVSGAGEPATRRAYLEAIPERRYGIRVHNHTGRRIGLVLAVDGRNIISGKRSQLQRNEPMYILGPWQSATYDGWRTSDTRVHRFFFTDADDSYAGAFGDKTAMGVIAVAAFAEDTPPASAHRYREKSSGDGDRGAAPSMSRDEAARSDTAQAPEPGTGFGEDAYSRVVRVRFVPTHRPFARQFLKYEWRDTLVRMGFIGDFKTRNRFWPDDRAPASAYGYAPYPPGHRW